VIADELSSTSALLAAAVPAVTPLKKPAVVLVSCEDPTVTVVLVRELIPVTLLEESNTTALLAAAVPAVTPLMNPAVVLVSCEDPTVIVVLVRELIPAMLILLSTTNALLALAVPGVILEVYPIEFMSSNVPFK
jgi:hypothetical protein